MGPYCKFCGTRCFAPLPLITPAHIVKAYGSSTIVATCREGQKFEKAKVGYCYDDIQWAIRQSPPDPKPEFEYGAYKPCGCLVGLAVDMADKETAKGVADFIKQGCHIERFPRSELDSRLAKGFGCNCGETQSATKVQPGLFELTGGAA